MDRTLIAALILCPALVLAAESTPIHISANQLEVRRDEGVILFSGQVSAVQGDFWLTCNQMKALFTGKNNVTELDAVGRVRFQQGVRHGTARHGHYAVAVSELVLDGTPVVFDGPNRLAGTRIRYSTADSRLRVQQADSTLYRQTLTGSTGPLAPPKKPIVDGRSTNRVQ